MAIIVDAGVAPEGLSTVKVSEEGPVNGARSIRTANVYAIHSIVRVERSIRFTTSNLFMIEGQHPYEAVYLRAVQGSQVNVPFDKQSLT